MAETERKKPSKSKKIVFKVTKFKRVGHKDIRYRKTVSDDEEFLMKNTDLDRQDSSETSAGLLHSLPSHRGIETLGYQDELGSKESRNDAEKSENKSKISTLEQSRPTDDEEFKVLKMSEIRLMETDRQCPELIIKSLNDIAINSNVNENDVGVISGKREVCYSKKNPNEEMTFGRIKALQTESSIIGHDQRRHESQRVPTSAEIAAKAKRWDTSVDRNDSRQSENCRQVKTIRRASKKRWKKSKKKDSEQEALQVSISGDKDSEIIEILEMDEDEKRKTKREIRKKRRKRAKKMAKTAGVTVWKGIREGWKLMWSGLAMYTLPLGSLDVSTNIAKVWSSKPSQ